MSIRYIKNGKWVKAGTEGAEVYGFQKGRKITKVDPEAITVSAWRGADGKIKKQYRAGGKFISKEVAEAVTATEQYLEAQAEKAAKMDEQNRQRGFRTTTAAFYDLAETVEGLVQVYDFESLTIRQYKNDILVYSETITDKDRAFYELHAVGYEGAKKAEEANKDEDSGTPTGVFSISVNYDEQGNYLVEYRF